MLKAEWFNLKNQDDFNKYYPIVKDWWEGKKWQAVRPDFLPSNGIIIKSDEEYICAGWLYCTDSLLGMISGIITNNQSIGNLKKESLDFLITNLEELAKKIGIKLVYIPMEIRSIARLLGSYQKTSENISEFFKAI